MTTRLRTLLGTVGPEPTLEVDADLRPEGRNGPLVRSFEDPARPGFFVPSSAGTNDEKSHALMLSARVAGCEGHSQRLRYGHFGARRPHLGPRRSGDLEARYRPRRD